MIDFIKNSIKNSIKNFFKELFGYKPDPKPVNKPVITPVDQNVIYKELPNFGPMEDMRRRSIFIMACIAHANGLPSSLDDEPCFYLDSHGLLPKNIFLAYNLIRLKYLEYKAMGAERMLYHKSITDDIMECIDHLKDLMVFGNQFNIPCNFGDVSFERSFRPDQTLLSYIEENFTPQPVCYL